MSELDQPADPRLRIGVRFAKLYAPLAVATVVVSSLDLYESIVQEVGSSRFTRRFGSVWELAWVDGGGVAGVGVALLLGLLVLLLKAGLNPGRGIGVPLGIAVLGAVCGLFVLLRVGIRPPLPELAAGGQATVAVAAMLVLTGTVHTVAATIRSPYRSAVGPASSGTSCT